MGEDHTQALRFLNNRLWAPLMALFGEALEAARDGIEGDDLFDIGLAAAQLGKSCYRIAKDAGADLQEELLHVLPDTYFALKETHTHAPSA